MANKYEIKAIIFDWDGVITTDDTKIASLLNHFGSKYGNAEKLNKAFSENWGKARINEINSRLFWKNIAKSLDVNEEKLRNDFISFTKLENGVLKLIKRMRKRYKLGLLSNHVEGWLEIDLDKFYLNEIFDVIVLSYESKVAKPDKKIYSEIIKKLKVKPSECVYVDDLERNLPPAKKLGMKTILFRNKKRLIKDLKKFGVKT